MPDRYTWPRVLSGLCPHAQLDSYDSHCPPVYDAISALSDCVGSAKTCHECQILLELIEDFIPGWIDSEEKENCMVRLTQDRPGRRHRKIPPRVELFIDQLGEGSIWERWQQRNSIGEFQYFRKCKSRFGISSRLE